MSPTPEASVVIPVFSGDRFLSEAIRSVLGQTVRPAEILVVDDGSTDDSAKVAGEFSEVRLISQAHAGVSVARNAGVAASRGALIAFLDGDDLWESERLERQIALAGTTPDAGVIMARQSYRFEGPVPGWFRGPVDGGSEPGYMPSNWLLRRETWLQVGGFTPGMSHSEDTDWLARASDLGVKVVMVDEPLVIHRIHDRNASGLGTEVKAGIFTALRDSVRRKHSAAEQTQ